MSSFPLICDPSPASCSSTPIAPLIAVGKSVERICAEQIESIAKKVVSQLLMTLCIDLEPVEEAFIIDERTDEQFQAFSGRYNPDSALMQWLLPNVLAQILSSFSNGNEFLKTGITFDFSLASVMQQVSESSYDQIAKIYTQFEENQEMEIGSVDFQMNLNETSTQRFSEIWFDLAMFINGEKSGHTSFTIDQCQKDALHGIL